VITKRATETAEALKTHSVVAYATPPRRVPRRVQTRLQQRRPVAVRRHASRTAIRMLIALAGDVLAVGTVVVASHLFVDAAAGGARWVQLAADGMLGAWPGSGAGASAAYAAAVILSLWLTGNYSRRTSSGPPGSILKASALAAGLVFWEPLFARGAAQVILPSLATVVLTWGAVYAWRRISDGFTTRVWPSARGAAPTILLGSEADYRRTVESAVSGSGGDYRLLGYVCLHGEPRNGAIGPLDELADIIDHHRIETVIVGAPLSDEQLAEVLDVSLTAGCELLYPARSMKIGGLRPKLIWRHDEAFFELGAPMLKARQLMVKRLVDIVGAGMGMVLLAPLFLCLALAIRLDSPGPVLFSQNRAGLGGRRFRMLKFRTMRVGADAEKEALAHLNHTGDRRLFKIPNDPRVTRLGAMLRRWSLDELPQLWNVLVGDMSLIGPRPFFESDLDDYEDHHFRRLGVKPGVTGLWQVNGRSCVVDFEEVVRLDREYIERWSPLLDLSILLRTLPAVLRRTGAY
jgi:exopolysaccharide biosynthesis polyprenyl glycosylphosphotransferase